MRKQKSDLIYGKEKISKEKPVNNPKPGEKSPSSSSPGNAPKKPKRKPRK